MTGRNFADYFFNQTSRFGEHLATETVEHAEAPKSFNDLLKLTQLFEEHLLKVGLKAGQHVVISGPNSVAFLCVSLAVWRLNSVLIPLNPSYKPGEFINYLKQTECKLLLIDANLADCFDLTNVNCNVEVYDESGLRQCKCKECQTSEDSNKLTSELPNKNESNATAVLFFSSGTTSLPKLVKISHEALCSHLDIVCAVRLSQVLPKMGTDDVCLSILPYFHAGGLLTAFCDAYARSPLDCLQPI
ncbi:AMP-binding domain-containing protein [Aphelenchoides bicaudatus]|nr:AMP-binding domain-containing protein [Aphelenchoides bicaudatus]